MVFIPMLSLLTRNPQKVNSLDAVKIKNVKLSADLYHKSVDNHKCL